MEGKYYLNYEIYEKEVKLENMYFGLINKIHLEEIYSQVKKLKNYENMTFIHWKEDLFLRVQKKFRTYLFYLDIVKNKSLDEDHLYSKELFIKPIKLYLSDENYWDIVSDKQFQKFMKNIKILISIYIVIKKTKKKIFKYIIY